MLLKDSKLLEALSKGIIESLKKFDKKLGLHSAQFISVQWSLLLVSGSNTAAHVWRSF